MVIESADDNNVFSQEQINYLSSLHFINNIDTHLRILSNVRVIEVADNIAPRVVLLLEVLYDNARIDTLSFDLRNYGYEDIIHIAKNIRSNEFILQAVDNLLAGDIE